MDVDMNVVDPTVAAGNVVDVRTVTEEAARNVGGAVMPLLEVTVDLERVEEAAVEDGDPTGLFFDQF